MRKKENIFTIAFALGLMVFLVVRDKLNKILNEISDIVAERRESMKKLVVWTNPHTLMAAIWRAAVAICDWRTHLRKIKRQPIVDVVFIANMRSDKDRRRNIGKWRPRDGHFNGMRYWFNGIGCRIRVLDVTPEDLIINNGRKKGKESFLKATVWAQEHGAKVVLLAAGTKRFFGDGTNLKKMFPNLVFTIGDNGTFLLLQEETLRALKSANLKPGYCRIGVLGPYGFLGEMIVQSLKERNYDVVGIGPNIGGLQKVSEKFNIETCQTFLQAGKVDAVVACTHSKEIRLTADMVELIRKRDKKLLVVDVAEPSNLKYREFQKCKGVVIRQDAGNAYNSRLKYVLGAISYKMFSLTQGVTFGCFAEAMSIMSALKRGGEVKT